MRQYNSQFLDHVKQSGAAFNDAGARYGVQIQTAGVAVGETYWRVVGVHHLTPEENQANHTVFIEALDESGQRVTGTPAWAGWTWEGRQPDEEARPMPLDKGVNEPAGNIPLNKGQVLSIWITGLSANALDKSERVTNLHTAHPDERGPGGELWNSTFHHSFYVVFQRTRKAAGAGAPPLPPPPPQQPAPTPLGSLPPGVTVQFRAEPSTIRPGESSTLTWDVAGVGKVFLEVQGGAAHETHTIKPAATTTYLLRVFTVDGVRHDFPVTVTVQAAGSPPGATRPPTVTLSADNIEKLKAYPRPPNDNGIGLHFHTDLRDEFIERTVANLKSIRATWTLIHALDELQAERAARACFRAGIMPVVRIGKPIDENVDAATYVEGLRRALNGSGFPHDPARPPLYLQIFNEPEDDREWRALERPSDWVQTFGQNWARQAVRAFDAGGYPGIQVLDRPGFDAAVNSIQAMNRTDIWQRAFFAHHNYGENHPPAYPYDARNQADHPGRTIHDDYVCALKFLAHAAWMKERLGLVLPLIGGEGGWLPGGEQDKRYPKVETPLHAQYTKEMFEWLRTGVLANGEPLPDYLFSITAWIAGSWVFPGQNWWDNTLQPDGQLTQTINAMKSIPVFVRKFSWER